MSKKPIKPKACKHCGKEFMPRATTQVVCSILCASKLVTTKKIEAIQKAERKADKEKREALKSRKAWLSDAQAMFNKFIRIRDERRPCISCGALEATWDAGHYRTVAAAPQLRFHEDNCHKQCVHCNQYKSGNIVAMRKGMIERIGASRVEALEDDNSVRRWTIDEAKAIKEQYRSKIKEITTRKEAQ